MEPLTFYWIVVIVLWIALVAYNEHTSVVPTLVALILGLPAAGLWLPIVLMALPLLTVWGLAKLVLYVIKSVNTPKAKAGMTRSGG